MAGFDWKPGHIGHTASGGTYTLQLGSYVYDRKSKKLRARKQGVEPIRATCVWCRKQLERRGLGRHYASMQCMTEGNAQRMTRLRWHRLNGWLQLRARELGIPYVWVASKLVSDRFVKKGTPRSPAWVVAECWTHELNFLYLRALWLVRGRSATPVSFELMLKLHVLITDYERWRAGIERLAEALTAAARSSGCPEENSVSTGAFCLGTLWVPPNNPSVPRARATTTDSIAPQMKKTNATQDVVLTDDLWGPDLQGPRSGHQSRKGS